MVVTCLSVLLKRSEEILSTPLLSQMLSFHFFNHYFKKKGVKKCISFCYLLISPRRSAFGQRCHFRHP